MADLNDYFKSLFDICILQSSKFISLYSKINIIINLNLPFAHPRYFFGGDRPSQTTQFILYYIKFKKII